MILSHAYDSLHRTLNLEWNLRRLRGFGDAKTATEDFCIPGRMADNIRVVVRVRPLNEREMGSGCFVAWSVEDSTIKQTLTPDGRHYSGPSFSFDRIYGLAALNNRDIFCNVAQELVDGAIDGLNGKCDGLKL